MNYVAEVLASKKNHWNMQQSDKAIIGVEIRRKRLALSITLFDLAHKICSPSYLCKIERNQIQANMIILTEILERVSISGKQQDMLCNFYSVLLDAIRAFVRKDTDTIEKYVSIGIGFENYRYRILQFISNILHENYYMARENYDELVRLLEGMQDTDLMIFSVFSAILAYKEKNYKEVLDLLTQIDGLYLTDELAYLRYKYIFLASMMLGSQETYPYYYEAVTQITRMGYYDLLDEIHYAMALFCFKAEAHTIYAKTMKLIHNPMYRNTMEFLVAYRDMNYEEIERLRGMELSPFAKHLLSTLSTNESSCEIIHHLTTFQDDYDFNSYILKYFALRDEEEKRVYLVNELSKLIYSTDYYVIRYFLKESMRLNTEKGHYKDTVRLYSLYVSYL